MWHSERLEKLRSDRGVSARDLARQLGGVSDTTVGRWLSGEGEPRFSDAVKLADFFGVDLRVFAGQPVPPPEPAAASVPREEEVAILKVFRALRLTEEEAIRRLAMPGEPGGRGLARVVGVADESEMAKRQEDEQKRRLGFELETEVKAEGREVENGPSLPGGR